FRENPDLLSSDGVHPSSEGYDGMRQLWASVMYENVYTAASTEPVPPVVDDADIGDLNSDGSVDSEDIKLMTDYLTGKSDSLGNSTMLQQDILADSKINVLDLVALKHMVNGEDTGVTTEGSWELTEENAKLIGRTVRKDDVTWLVQSGSAVEFTVSGTEAEIVLAGDECINNGEDYRPRYQIYVDDELVKDSTLSKAEEKITLTLHEEPMVDIPTYALNSTVKVIMVSEAMYGAIGVNAVNLESNLKKPVKPTAKNDLCIEFIGDSITCAYGVEASGNGESFKTTTENFTKSYAYLTAKQLGADYNAVCYSGHGIISGYTSGDKNTDSLIPDCYEVASKQNGYAESWDFENHKNDVVVINLGTNDSSYITAGSNANREERAAEFIDGYVAFLKTVREKNADAKIICTLGTMDFENVYEYVSDAVDKYKEETGDEDVTFYQSVMHTQADGYGADWHPSEKTQQNSAYVLADKICQVLGIESSQIGLDVAADAVYDIAINTASGANASHYVGYDKSFWINTVTGGSSAEDIKAVLSGIGLKKGGEYRLEFDYTAAKEFDMTVNVTGADVYFTDTVVTSSEKLHFSQVFT
ncbi:MAG: hypothetical protein IJX24_03340, partial [Oscillospiraceae bacterium]|nr:hypothetical protein [Oscillospiraceae bacterium]